MDDNGDDGTGHGAWWTSVLESIMMDVTVHDKACLFGNVVVKECQCSSITCDCDEREPRVDFLSFSFIQYIDCNSILVHIHLLIRNHV